MKSLTASKISVVAGEPRVFDLHLAQALGFTDLHMIRRLIERNRTELEMHGAVSVTATETSPKGGRPGKAYYLNEGQALVLCALSETPKAAEVRKLLIDVFMAWRLGKTVHVKEHHRRPPSLEQRASALALTLADNGMARLDAFVPFEIAKAMTETYLALR